MSEMRDAARQLQGVTVLLQQLAIAVPPRTQNGAGQTTVEYTEFREMVTSVAEQNQLLVGNLSSEFDDYFLTCSHVRELRIYLKAANCFYMSGCNRCYQSLPPPPRGGCRLDFGG